MTKPKNVQLLALLPGSYYMDAPDGGDVSLIEQLQRMALDAKRYRWLRERCGIDLVIAKPDNWYGLESWSGDNPDASIDAAMKGTK